MSVALSIPAKCTLNCAISTSLYSNTLVIEYTIVILCRASYVVVIQVVSTIVCHSICICTPHSVATLGHWIDNCDPLSHMICRGNPQCVNPCRLLCLRQHLLNDCDPLSHMICRGSPCRVNPCRLLCLCQHVLNDCDPLSLMICRGNPYCVNPCRLCCLHQHLLYN